MFEPADSSTAPAVSIPDKASVDSHQAEQLSSAERYKFYGITRGIARFGILITGSLTLSLLSRMIPILAVPYWILLSATTLLTLGYGILGKPNHRLIAGFVLVCLIVGTLLGTWDAVAGLVADNSGQALALKLLLIGASFLLVVAIAKVFFQQSSKQKQQSTRPNYGFTYPEMDNDLWTSDTSSEV